MARGPVPLLLVAALVVTSGCLSAPQKLFDWAPRQSSIGAVEPSDWANGYWWGYEATFQSGKSLRVALIVFEGTPDHFMLGTNSTAGFFGLPFAGNVTRANKNPIIGGEEWQLFQFPLQVGKKWEYSVFGYPAMADVVREVDVEVPGIPKHKGFELEAFSYGQLFARYTYSPVTKWFTSLTLYEPTNGAEVVRVELKEFGKRYNQDFYVQVPLQVFTATYPSLTGEETFRILGAYKSLTTYLTLKGEVGEFNARLLDPHGQAVLEGEVHGQGAFLDRKTTPYKEGEWTIEHLGLGKGSLRVEVLGLAKAKARGGAPFPVPAPPGASAPFLDLAALLARSAPAGAEPALPVPLPIVRV